MKINVVHVIEGTNPDTQQGEYAKGVFNKLYRQANLYEIERKPVVQITYNGKHIRYAVKR
jgi:hypothetical protein